MRSVDYHLSQALAHTWELSTCLYQKTALGQKEPLVAAQKRIANTCKTRATAAPLHSFDHYIYTSLLLSIINTTMKSFQAVILAAIVASSAAINEPVASPTAAIERELAEYERQLGTDVSPAPTPDGNRVSLQFISYPVKSCLLELRLSNIPSGQSPSAAVACRCAHVVQIGDCVSCFDR